MKILKITISGENELRPARDFLFGIILAELNDLPTKTIFIIKNYDENSPKLQEKLQVQKKYKLKNWKNLSFDFCPKSYADWPKSTTGGTQNIFWAEKSILKFFDFWT